MTTWELLSTFGFSLTLGLLVGFQRQRVEDDIAGLRSFAMITLAGTLCGVLAAQSGPWLVAAGLLSLSVLLVVANMARQARQPGRGAGLTTEATVLAMFLLGAAVPVIPREVAAALAGAIALLLHLKSPLHEMVRRLGEQDVKAIMQFVLIALIILPLLPDEKMGPYGAFNPHRFGMLAALIVGLSLAGYLAIKFGGGERGAALAGVLGGLVSSTATTVSAARQAKGEESMTGPATLIVTLASSVVFGRVAIEIAAAAPGSSGAMIGPVAVVLVVALAMSALVWRSSIGRAAPNIDPKGNPSQIKSALIFTGLFALVTLGAAWVRTTGLGDRGVYALAAVSGLTDMDAITLTLGRMVEDGGLPAATAWRAILVASVSNLGFKLGIVAALGTPALARRVAVVFGVIAAAAGAVIFLYPAG